MDGKCEAYSKIREKYGDLSYFSEILEERERLQEEGEERSPSGGGDNTMEDASGCLQLPAGLGSLRTS